MRDEIEDFVFGREKMESPRKRPLKKDIKIQKEGQSFLEYTLLLGIIVVLLLSMMPLMRRSIQGMVKAVSDQVGSQVNADSGEDEEARLIYANTYTQYYEDTILGERAGNIIYTYDPLRIRSERETKSVIKFDHYE